MEERKEMREKRDLNGIIEELSRKVPEKEDFFRRIGGVINSEFIEKLAEKIEEEKFETKDLMTGEELNPDLMTMLLKEAKTHLNDREILDTPDKKQLASVLLIQAAVDTFQSKDRLRALKEAEERGIFMFTSDPSTIEELQRNPKMIRITRQRGLLQELKEMMEASHSASQAAIATLLFWGIINSSDIPNRNDALTFLKEKHEKLEQMQNELETKIRDIIETRGEPREPGQHI